VILLIHLVFDKSIILFTYIFDNCIDWNNFIIKFNLQIAIWCLFRWNVWSELTRFKRTSIHLFPSIVPYLERSTIPTYTSDTKYLLSRIIISIIFKIFNFDRVTAFSNQKVLKYFASNNMKSVELNNGYKNFQLFHIDTKFELKFYLL